jgi:hypothetical protein
MIAFRSALQAKLASVNEMPASKNRGGQVGPIKEILAHFALLAF